MNYNNYKVYFIKRGGLCIVFCGWLVCDASKGWVCIRGCWCKIDFFYVLILGMGGLLGYYYDKDRDDKFV